MDKQVNVHAAKTHLSRLLEEVLLGEEVVIARGGKPVARLVPVQEAPARRTPGTARGLVRMTDDFDAPLPADLAEAFEP
ncbi:type II toxin-antitoxin system Phd/YefM family antitoxin [Oceanithermus sp.]